MYDHGNLESLKRVAPLCLSFCRGAPFLNIVYLCSRQKKTVIWFVLLVLLNETNQMNQINKTDQTDLSYARRAGYKNSAMENGYSAAC
jgi:hypothetical protein